MKLDISDVDTANEVQSFYERMPYPAPLTNLDRHLELYRNPERRRALFHLMWPTEKPHGNQTILVAGCGTSQAATIALREPDAQVTAIDISETSLRHTRNLQRQYKLENLELLYEWLERCGMSFGRWFEQAPYLPQCGAVAKTPHATHLGKLPTQSQYTAVELFRGTMTKHNFIAYRNDYPGERQPIQFDDEDHSSRSPERWRHYIPLRLPWTVCIRERVPPGAVAVLINRAHTYPDLLLPLDVAQDRLLAAIDGKRTIDEIIQLATERDREKLALKFFQRLWQYDQVAFDCSRQF